MPEHDPPARGIGPAVATIVAIVIAIIGSFYVGFGYSRVGNEDGAIEVMNSSNDLTHAQPARLGIRLEIYLFLGWRNC